MRQTQFPNLREDYTSPLVPPIRVGFAGRDHDSQVAINVVAYLRYAVVFEKKERWTEETLLSLFKKRGKMKIQLRVGKSLSLVRFFKEYCGSIHPFKDPVYSFGYLCVRLNRATGSSHSQAEQQKQPTAKARGGCRCRTDPLPHALPSAIAIAPL